eukprot:SAG31_NODE_956_length_10790_cov_34.583107_11_plen_104_part_00
MYRATKVRRKERNTSDPVARLRCARYRPCSPALKPAAAAWCRRDDAAAGGIIDHAQRTCAAVAAVARRGARAVLPMLARYELVSDGPRGEATYTAYLLVTKFR